MSHRIAAAALSFADALTEEINHGYDGGLYAEPIQNRTCQGAAGRGRGATTQPSLAPHGPLTGDGKASLDRNDPVNPAPPVSLRVDLSGATAGVANDGSRGIPVRPDTTCTVHFHAKAAGGFSGPVSPSPILADGGPVAAKADSPAVTASWQNYTLKLATGGDPLDATIDPRGAGAVRPEASAWVLGGDLKAQNTIEEPTKISPKQETWADVSAAFRRTFPPYSFTPIRLAAPPQ